MRSRKRLLSHADHVTILSRSLVEEKVVKEKSWKHIVFLIFSSFWIISINVNIFFNGIMCLYYMIFADAYPLMISIMYYVFEFHYGIDTVLSILHMKWEQVRKRRFYDPKHIGVLILNVITLLPIYEVYYLLVPPEQTAIRDYFRAKCTLRYIILSMHLYSTDAFINRFNQLVIVTLKQLFVLNTSAIILCCLWYEISRSGWMNRALYLKAKYDHNFRTNDTFHWFVMSYTKTLNVLIQNMFFGFHWESTFEYILCTTLIVLGFNIQMVIFIAKLTSAYIHRQLMYFAFMIKMHATAMFLEDLNVDEGLRQRAMEYCDKLWMLRNGNLTTPASFTMLPISLQKDISNDIFWDALQHSQLFEEVSMSLKRVISLKMKNIFLMPGTYLYKKGQMKSQMIYVVSGNVQVLSSEDNISPILNLTCGTVLGEINTLISTRSTINLYTANGCTLHILDLPDLFYAIAQSKYTSNELKSHLNNRIKLIKEMQVIKHQMVSAYETMEDKYNTPIKRLKTNWQMVWNLDSQQRLDVTEIKEKIDVSYCSKFLDLLVMTESLGSNMLANSICIRNSCPFVVEPNSSFRKAILYISLGSTVINAVILPFCISFLNELPRILFSYCLLLDVTCWLELYFELITAIKTPTVTVTAPLEIFLTKIKTPKFFVDLFASLPIDYFVFWNSDNLVYASMCRLNRLIRVYRIYIVLHEWDESIVGNATVKKVCKYAIYYSSTIYFFTCMLYSIACPGKCLRYSWFNYNMRIHERIRNNTISDRFMASLNLASSMILRCQFANIISYNIYDVIIFTIVWFIGYIMYAFCISECACYGLQESLIKNVYEERFNTLRYILKKANMSHMFIRFVIDHLEFKIFNKRFSSQLDKDGIDLSKDLKEEIDYTRIVKSLKRVQMFQILDDEVLLQISKIVQVLGVQIKSAIITTGQVSPWLHIIEKGQCLVYSTIVERGKTIASTIETGATFPIIESIFRLPSLIYVETVTHCQIMYIPIDKLLLMLEVHDLKTLFDPAKYDSIINYINLLDYQINWNSVGTEASSVFFNMSQTPIVFKRKKKIPHDFGKISFLRYLMLWKTINPQSKLYIGWEISRCILATIQLLINSYCLTILYEYSDVVFLCNIALDITGYIDMYIRLHVQYYNDKQILVTHPLYTAKHYLTTSFIVDLYGVMPYHILKLQHLFFANTLLTYHLHIVWTRSLQMWRMFGGLHYLMSISKDKMLAVLRTAKIIIIYFIFEMFFINYVLPKVCVFEEHSMNCVDYDLFKDTPDKGRDPYYIRSTISYVVVAFFTGTSTFFFKKMNVKQLGDYYIALVAMVSLRIYLMTYYIAILVAGHFSAIANRSQVKNFMDFAKKENVDDDTFTTVVKEYEHRWKQTNGLDFIKEIESMQYEIRYKLLDFLFGVHIAAAPLFIGADESLIHLLTMKVNIEYFIRNTIILQMNDVQNKLYIVYKGIIEINIDDTNVLDILGRGSVFGSFAKRGYTRQTINAKALAHCELLYIDADVFNRLASCCPVVMSRIKRIRFLNQEYVCGSSDDMKSESNKRWINIFSKKSIYENWSVKINLYFKQESKWIKQIRYLFYMHYTPLSIVATTVTLVHSKCGNVSVLCLLMFNYVIDIPFWIRLCANMTLQYTDKDTGHVIVNPAKIRHRYMHSYSFILDILILFPFEAFIYIFSAEFAFIGLIPRIFRVLHFFMYYDNYRSTFNYESHICVFFYIYLNLTYVSFFSGIWSQLSCKDPCCFPERRETEGKDCLLVGWEMLFDGLIFSVNNIASSNLKVDPPNNTFMTIVCMFSNFTAPFVVAIMLCSITNIFNACYYNQMLYFRTMNELLVNLKKQDLSPSLLQKTARFFTVMWKCARGENLPHILQIASPILKEQVLMNIYGNHIQNHYLFANTHIDFIRQVVRTLEKIIYLPGYHIVRQGDNDGCMYFVNSGEVESRSLMKSGEMRMMYVLHTGNSFGEGSGLFNVAHHHTYVCRTIVEVLVLKREKWVFLWKWFPASYEMMLIKAREFQVDGCYQQQESNENVPNIQTLDSSVK